VSPDGEHFLSADDQNINLWNLRDKIVSYNLAQFKVKANSEPQIITHCEFHPTRADTFIYSSAHGYISLCDLR
jgi:serine/threonine-protein phosphatase 2A regulatory subunit B